MNNQEIVDYVMHTPRNTNPAILKQMLDNRTDLTEAVLYIEQTLTSEQQAQARKNIGAFSGLISILDTDPTKPKEGQMWILKSSASKLTTPVIELGNVTENSIEIKLSNASFDGSGEVVASYNVYVNGELNKTENIEPGGICVVTGLSADTEYQISVCGVNGAMLSAMSNVLMAATLNARVYTVGEGDCVAVPGYSGVVTNGVHCIQLNYKAAQRAMMMMTSGDEPFTNKEGVTGTYYPFAVPADATKAIVTCPTGVTFSYNGYTVTDGQYERTIDSGFKASGTEITFDAGQCQYCYIFFSKASDMIVEELLGSKLTFE